MNKLDVQNGDVIISGRNKLHMVYSGKEIKKEKESIICKAI